MNCPYSATLASSPVQSFRRFVVVLILAGLTVACSSAQTRISQWRSIGPYGGDARSFTAVPGEPQHLYLGGTDNWIFESTDGGVSWNRLSRIDTADEQGDLIVDSVIVDSSDHQTIFAGVWRTYRADGGLYVSHDGGRHWGPVAALHGQSLRSLAQAPSDANVIVAGTLEGIYRSQDHGRNWERISPPADDPLSKEIHEVESLAIDPRNPEIIYAGTWHLPWKTKDGGKSWHNIKQGVIDDSDVFSIIVDPEKPAIVYASACSGIYKSENGGELFHKIQGIPSTARRTRVLMQDPRNREIVYAGTTEGLYRTRDAGREWQRLTGPDTIVNDIYVDPDKAGHLLLATDRSGVLSSDDAGATFAQSNQGFSARKVEALVADARDPRRILAGVVNDKSYGGVFLTTDSGANWAQIATGLDGRDVFTMAQAKNGTVLAGTSHGIFALVTGENFSEPHWEMRSSIVNTGNKVTSETVGGKKINRVEEISLPARQMSSRVAAFDLSSDVWLVTTAEGIFTSADEGVSWQGGLVMGSTEYKTVAVWDGEMLAARRGGVIFSRDKGKNWAAMAIPAAIKDIRKVAFSNAGELWVADGDGIYFSRDKGKSWFWLEKVPVRDVGDMAFDSQTGHMLACSRSSVFLYSIDPTNLTYSRTATGFRLFLARSVGAMRFASSLQDGVLTDSEAPKLADASAAPVKAENAAAAGAGPGVRTGAGTEAVHPALPPQ
jgi:photosystem II stability/assembly factor-like uncharacterized protein